jgi:hypothetical protein
LRRFPSFPHCLFGKVQTIAKENGTNTYNCLLYIQRCNLALSWKVLHYTATVDFVWCCKMAAYSLCFEWKVKRFISGFQGGISLPSFFRNTKINCCEVLLSLKEQSGKDQNLKTVWLNVLILAKKWEVCCCTDGQVVTST